MSRNFGQTLIIGNYLEPHQEEYSEIITSTLWFAYVNIQNCVKCIEELPQCQEHSLSMILLKTAFTCVYEPAAFTHIWYSQELYLYEYEHLQN